MNSIIIFRFDRNQGVCKNHLELIQKLNPGVPIHGVYGGKDKDFAKYKKSLGTYFSSLYCIKNKSKDWKWKNFDLALRSWYLDRGHAIDFDMAYVIEWDLLLLDSVKKMYSHIKNGEVGLTGLTKLSTIESRWSWTSEEPYKSQWSKLLGFVKKKFKYAQKPWGSLGPGLCFPKKFLEKYSKAEVPELVHDELRVPLYAQIFGFTLKDTKFTKSFFDQKEHVYFNCRGMKEFFINIKTIRREMKKPNGRKAFHPFRDYFEG